jgi:aspartate racemase
MTLEQKTIGIIGGTSWESTALYYKLINESIRDHLGNLNSAKIVLYSVNYEPIVKLEQEGAWEEIGRQLGGAAKSLENAGADFVILCCNTLHKVTSSIESAINVPFLHIADAAGRMLGDNKVRKIGLLGTKFTMEDGFYASRLKSKFGLEVIVPSLSDRNRLDGIIYNELCQGKVLAKSKEEMVRMIKQLQAEGAEAILLGCTELGMIVAAEDASIPVYDTTLLHAKEAVNLSIKQMSQLQA